MQQINQFIELTKKNLEYDSGCGGWCIRCALGNTLTEYDEINGCGVSFEEVVNQLSTGKIEAVSDSDDLMLETREYLKSFGNEKMVFNTKEEALCFLDKAMQQKYANTKQ